MDSKGCTMVGAMDTPPRSIPATPGAGQPLVGFAVPGACPCWYLGILLGELSNLLLSLGHVMSQQKGARRAPVLQQRGEGVGVPWEHPQTVPLQLQISIDLWSQQAEQI